MSELERFSTMSDAIKAELVTDASEANEAKTANEATATLALAQDAKAAKSKARVHKHASEAIKLSENGNVVTLTLSRPITLYVHEDAKTREFYCDYDNSADFELSSCNDTMQAKRIQAIKYALRNSLYQCITRDVGEARATSTTLKTQNAELASSVALANAQNAVLMYAMSVPNATLTQAQYNTATSVESFVAMLSQLEAKNRNRLRAFAKVATDAAVEALAQANARASESESE